MNMAPEEENSHRGSKDFLEKQDSYRLQLKESIAVLNDEAGRGLGIRHLQTGLMAVAAIMAYALRVILSVAIVAMVDHDADAKGNHTVESESTYPPTYHWDEETQGMVLSAFFLGYVTTQIPAGMITERYGGHTFLSGAIFVSGVLTMLLPQCVYFGGWQLFCANRMLQGVVQGFVFPSIYTLLGVWAPPAERGFLSSVALGAQLLGANFAAVISGVLSGFFGWPSIFYCFGVASTLAGIILAFLGANYPSTHRFISQEEKTYVQKSLGGAKVRVRVPWRDIFRSTPVWSTILTCSFLNAVFLTFMAKIPTYLGTVLKFNIKENGLLSAIPYFVTWMLTYPVSWFSDVVARRGWLNLTQSRKTFNSVGMCGTALCAILMSYANSPTMSVCLLTATIGFSSGTYPGVQANFVDLAPNYSGTIFSLSNFLSACLSFTGPIIIGYMVTESGNSDQWRSVFFLLAAVLFTGNLIFVTFATAETQHWNWPDRGETGETNDENDKDNQSKTIS